MENKFIDIKWVDRFQSRGQQLCKLLGIKESFNMWKEFNSHRIFLYTNMAADSLFCTQIWPPWRHVKTTYTIAKSKNVVTQELIEVHNSFSFLLIQGN